MWSLTLPAKTEARRLLRTEKRESWVGRYKPDSVRWAFTQSGRHLSVQALRPVSRRSGMRLLPGVTSAEAEWRAGRSFSCYVLHRMGFVVPPFLRSERWALTPPFHPFLVLRQGGLFSVTLSVTGAFAVGPRRFRAACCPMVSGLSSRCIPQSETNERLPPADPPVA